MNPGPRSAGKGFTDTRASECPHREPESCKLQEAHRTHDFFPQKYVPPNLVFKDLQKHKLDVLIQRQTKIIADWRKEHPKECEEDPDCYKRVPELRAFCVLDDVISDRVAMQWCKELNTFFVNGRHYCVSVFITSQHVKVRLFAWFIAVFDPLHGLEVEEHAVVPPVFEEVVQFLCSILTPFHFRVSVR